MGKGQTTFWKFSRVTWLIASGFLRSEANLAKTLLKETPMETVSPSSCFTLWRIISAISKG